MSSINSQSTASTVTDKPGTDKPQKKKDSDLVPDDSDSSTWDKMSVDTPAANSDNESIATIEGKLSSVKIENAQKIIENELERIVAKLNPKTISMANYKEFKKKRSKSRERLLKVCQLYDQDESFYDNVVTAKAIFLLCPEWKKHVDGMHIFTFSEFREILDPRFKEEASIDAYKGMVKLLDRLGKHDSKNYLFWKLKWHQKEMVRLNRANTFKEPDYSNFHLNLSIRYCRQALEGREKQLGKQSSLQELISVVDNIPLLDHYRDLSFS